MTHQSRRALIVIDVQNEYVTGNLPIEYPDIQSSLSNISRAMDAAADTGIPIIVVQQYAPAESPIFATGSDGWELHPVVRSRTWNHYIEKKLPSAFAGTDLDEWLNAHQINTLTVVGYMTHNCDDSTIRHAFHAGLAVEFLADAAGALPYLNQAGSASAEEIHRVFTVVMQSRFAAVMTTLEWIDLLRINGSAKRDNIFQSNLAARSTNKAEALSLP
ncbi:MAG: cysteine hydrolase family protein [Sulfuriferula sp.]